MISMGRSRTLLGLVVAVSLASASPVLAVTTTTPVTGSMGPTQEGCPQQVATTVVAGENCMYDGGPSSVPAATPFGEVTGSYLQVTYYDSVATPASFQSTDVGVARVLYAPTVGDGKIFQKIAGSVTIDDGGDGFGAGDLISFTLTLTSPGTGAIVRNYLSSTNSVVDKYDSMTQVLAPTAATSATPNADGGFDYVIGSEGFPTLRTYSQAGPCLGKTLGFVECNHTLTAAEEPDFWNGTSAAGLGSLESNSGAKTTGTVTNLQCIDARLRDGTESDDCHDSVVSYAPWVNGPCATKGGCTGNESTPGSVRGAAEDVGWDQLLFAVSTDASGNVISFAGFNVDDYNAFGTVRCGDNTTGTPTGPQGYNPNCNSWTSGYFSSATGGETDSATVISTIGVAPLGLKGTFTVPGGVSNITISAQGARGTAVPVGNVITYTVTDNTFFFGEDNYTYTGTDAGGESASGIVTVTIPEVATVFKDTFIVVGQGRISKPLAPDFSAPDPTDTANPPAKKKYYFNGSPEQQTLVISGQGTEGVCAVSPEDATGQVIYTPNDSTFVGSDSCQLTLTDADGNIITRPVSITVTAKEKVGGAGSFDSLSLLLLGCAPLLRRLSRRKVRGRFLRTAGTAVAVLAFLAGGLTASGQATEESQSESVAAPPPPGPAVEDQDTGRSSAAIQEIIVTSRKIEENLQEVPLAITAFDANAIEKLGITSLSDVAALTPGLSFFNAFGESLPVPVIRGIAPTDIFGENNAAIFVDGVYVSGREGLNFSQLDVERIEVVKGPQSALYGRNAFSGAINYVTKPPSEEFSARTDMEVGNRGKVLGSVTVSGPILGEKLRGRIAALYDDWDGSYDNSISGGNDIGGHTFRSIQGSLLWLPAEDWTTSLSVYTSSDDIDEAASVSLPANCQDRVGDNNDTVRLQNFCGEIPALEDIPGLNGSDAIPIIPQGNGEHRELDRANLKIDWDLHESGAVSALTGYSHTKQNSQTDFARGLGENQVFLYCENAGAQLGFGAPNSCGENPANKRFTSGIYDREPGTTTDDFSQELRFTSPQDERWRYTAGGYFFTVNKTSAATPAGSTLRGATIATRPLPGGRDPIVVGLPPFDTSSSPNLAIGTAIFFTTFLPDGGQDPLDRTQFESDTKGWALFGGSDFDITDQLIFRTELRLSQESQDVRNYTYAPCTNADHDPATSPCGDDRFDLRVRGQQPYGDCVPKSADSLGTGDCSRHASARFKSVTGRVGLDWRFNDEWMVYGSIAYGEKPGGLEFASGNVQTPNGTEGRFFTSSFDPEELTAYELGLKGTAWDGRLVISTSVYYNDWTKIVLPQLRDTDPVEGLPLAQPTAFRVNSGDAGVLGFEIETNVGLTDNLTGRFTLGWADAEIKSATQSAYTDFPDYAAEGFAADGGDVSGNTLLRQPEWLLSGSLDYQHQLTGEWDWFTGADANYQSGVYVGNENQGWLPSHTYVNTRLGVQTSVYTIQAWARDLFDDNKAVASFRDIYFANTDNQYPPVVDQGPRPNFDDFVPWRETVSYPNERTYGLTFLMRFGAAAE